MKYETTFSRQLTKFNPIFERSLRTVAAQRIFPLSLLALAALTGMPLRAQESSVDADSQTQLSAFTDHGLEGVWDVTVTIRDANGNPLLPPFHAMNMYIRGGQFEEFGVRTPPSRRGPGMGVWQREGSGSYRAVLEFFLFNADGTFAGTQKVTRTIELSAGEDSFTSSAQIQILDINGQLIPPVGYATETATRFQ
jgi:hypothetical protein